LLALKALAKARTPGWLIPFWGIDISSRVPIA
jgi:hypothetical protein